MQELDHFKMAILGGSFHGGRVFLNFKNVSLVITAISVIDPLNQREMPVSCRWAYHSCRLVWKSEFLHSGEQASNHLDVAVLTSTP
jgi:hypothetical protein